MEVKVAVLIEISQNHNFFEVKLVPYASYGIPGCGVFKGGIQN